jgi:hypothetical protein
LSCNNKILITIVGGSLALGVIGGFSSLVGCPGFCLWEGLDIGSGGMSLTNISGIGFY